MSNSLGGITAGPTAGAVVSHRSRFFLTIALVMFLPVAVGFGPTFFLRPWSGAADYRGGPFPVHLIVHGGFLSAWFLLFVAQPTLVAAHRVDLHRRLGVIGVGVAVGVTLASIVTIVRFVPRATAAGAPEEAILGVSLGDLAALVVFMVCVGSAVYWRRRPAAHARLMFLASVFIVAPAFSASRPIGRAVGQYGEASGLVFQVACIVALVVCDVVTRKRVHPATWFGIAMYLASAIAVVAAIVSGLGAAFVDSLR
jgi:hypothetical protein